MWNSGGNVLVLVWESESDLRAGNQPLILRCRPTTNNAGPDSALHGSNPSNDPIAGFKAIVFDATQLAMRQVGRRGGPRTVTIWSGQRVELFDVEFPTEKRASSEVDGTVTPTYRFYLEVEQVIFPAEGSRPDAPDMVWTRESFAVAQDRGSIRYEQVPGYLVSPIQEEEIRRCLREVLHVDPEQAKVLPVSEYDQPKLGKRTTSHPLHETFIGPSSREERDDFYRRAESGSLLAELDPSVKDFEQRMVSVAHEAEPIRRVQRVLTAQLRHLEQIWRGTALRYRGRN